MATLKSTRAPRKSPVKQSAKRAEMKQVPCLKEADWKAPADDPYIRPETLTTETLTFGDITLPPIQSGLQPGRGLRGEAVNYPVKVIHINRRQIDWALREIKEQHPELETILKIVSAYMCNLDTLRSEARLGIGAAKGWIKTEKPDLDVALEQLDQVTEMLGTWQDEHRLHVR